MAFIRNPLNRSGRLDESKTLLSWSYVEPAFKRKQRIVKLLHRLFRSGLRGGAVGLLGIVLLYSYCSLFVTIDIDSLKELSVWLGSGAAVFIVVIMLAWVQMQFIKRDVLHEYRLTEDGVVVIDCGPRGEQRIGAKASNSCILWKQVFGYEIRREQDDTVVMIYGLSGRRKLVRLVITDAVSLNQVIEILNLHLPELEPERELFLREAAILYSSLFLLPLGLGTWYYIYGGAIDLILYFCLFLVAGPGTLLRLFSGIKFSRAWFSLRILCLMANFASYGVFFIGLMIASTNPQVYGYFPSGGLSIHMIYMTYMGLAFMGAYFLFFGCKEKPGLSAKRR